MTELEHDYWICQGDNTTEVLEVQARIPWRVRSYMRQIQPGDYVYFWKMGDEAGIYGWGIATSEEPYRDGDGNWRYDIECNVVLEKWIPKDRLREDAILNQNLPLFLNPHGSLSPVPPDHAAIINGVIRELGQESPPDPNLPDDEPTPSGPSTALTREEFLSQFQSAAPDELDSLKAFLSLAEERKLTISFGKSSVIFNWVSDDNQRVNVGMIRTDGSLDTRYVAYFTKVVAGSEEIGKQYLEALAKLISGAAVHQEGRPWTWRVVVDGRRPPAATLLEQPDKWLQAIDALIEGIANELVQQVQGLRTHTDVPSTTVDHLLRRPFAAAIGWRLRYVHLNEWAGKRDNEQSGAFLVHLYAPWGAGKTTTLNFLAEHLRTKQQGATELGRRWLVVSFNAWRHQRTSPPWWPFLKEASSQIRDELRNLSGWWSLRPLILSVDEYLWRTVRGRLHLLISAIVAVIAIFVAFFMFRFEFGKQLIAHLFPPEQTVEIATAESVLKIFSLLFGLLASLWAFMVGISRSLVTGSSAAAAAFIRETDDPEEQLKQRFQAIIGGARHPVAIFIDDLDRCTTKYAVEFLEGIQTMFREAPVAYVVAADRDWICNCFAKAFADFESVVQQPGRPLGHLFLEKTFQISVPLPNMAHTQMESYYNYLLRPDDRQSEEDTPEESREIRRRARIQSPVNSEQRTPQERELHDRVRRLATPQAEEEMTEELETLRERIPGILEANPRAIKRTVNCFGMWRTIDLLQGKGTSDELLARWAVACSRWPAFTDLLVRRPELASRIGTDEELDGVPEELARMFQDEDVQKVFSAGKGRNGFDICLGETQLQNILGQTN